MGHMIKLVHDIIWTKTLMKFNLVNQIFEIDSNDNAKRLFFSADTQESFE